MKGGSARFRTPSNPVQGRDRHLAKEPRPGHPETAVLRAEMHFLDLKFRIYLVQQSPRFRLQLKRCVVGVGRAGRPLSKDPDRGTSPMLDKWIKAGALALALMVMGAPAGAVPG